MNTQHPEFARLHLRGTHDCHGSRHARWLVSAIKLFANGVDATWVISRRAEMQQDLRAVQNMLTKDISLAGRVCQRDKVSLCLRAEFPRSMAASVLA